MGAGTRATSAAVVGLALTLAACGSGDDDSSSAASEVGLEDLIDELDEESALGDVDLGELEPDGSTPDDVDLGDLDLDLDNLEDLDLSGLDLGALLAGGLGGLEDLFGAEGLEELIEESTDGAVDIEVGDDGLSVESDDGSFSIDEDGEFTVTDDQGNETTGRLDVDDGELTIEGDDGALQFGSGSEFPAEWPDDVPRPEGVEVQSGIAVDDDATTSVVVTGTVAASAEEWAADYVAELEAAGFEETATFEAGTDVTSSLENDAWNVVVVTTSVGDTTRVSVTVTSLG
jgi:hypothetical protein